jgi:hypothetical protein
MSSSGIPGGAPSEGFKQWTSDPSGPEWQAWRFEARGARGVERVTGRLPSLGQN